MKNRKITLIGLLLTSACLLALTACEKSSAAERAGKVDSMTIVSKRILEEVPSASGVELMGEEIFMIGDNSPWLYRLNKAYEVTDRYQVFSTEGLEDGIIPKARKPDFEAMAIANWGRENQLLLFGSGSKSPERDSLVIMGLEGRQNDVSTYSIKPFYDQIKRAAKLGDEDLNIEGAAVVDTSLYLFNRGENIVIRFALDGFLRHVIAHEPAPALEIIEVELPEIKGIKAGFSGATVVPNQRRILFTASVENTENWIADGEILGSFVGTIDLDDLKNGHRPKCVPIMEEDKTLNIKVESLTVQNAGSGGELEVILVTDSDGGHSELLEIRLN